MNIAAGDVLPAVDADAGAAPRGSANIRHLSRMELPGGGQIVIQGTTAFVGHQVGPEGTTILDISDPRKPKIVSQIMCPHPWSHTHKARVVGDIMVVNSEREPGKGNLREYPEGGFRIYDVKDRTNPKLITFHKTYGKGVHRFDMDENYAYISTEMEGYVGNILVIYDIRNPSKPVEVGRWCMENQHVANGETPHPKGTEHRLHHAMRSGNLMFAGCWMSGLSASSTSATSPSRRRCRATNTIRRTRSRRIPSSACRTRSAARRSRSPRRRSATRAVPITASRTARSGPGT